MIINNITFNFLDKYYPFYEWLAEDELITKKCYVYKVSSNVLSDLIEYNIILDKSFLKDIPLVFCDDYTAIGVQFNSSGESTYKSSLLLTDATSVLPKPTSPQSIYFLLLKLFALTILKISLFSLLI